VRLHIKTPISNFLLERGPGGVVRRSDYETKLNRSRAHPPNPPQGGNNRLAVFFITIMLFASLAFADEAATLFQQGNQAYQAGNYEQAAAAFEQIIALKKENWQVYYNLGNAYFKQRKIGWAILNYERALRLNRTNEDIRFNLDLANLSITDRIIAPPRSAVLIWLDSALKFFPLEQTAGWALLFWWGLLLGLILFLAGRKAKWQQLGGVLAWSAGAACLLFSAIFFWLWYDQKNQQYVIVLDRRVPVYNEPVADATEVFIIHEGAKVKLQEQAGAWQRIRLADGKVGWLKAESVVKI